MELDFLPSPVEDRPGLLVRDPFQFSDVTLIIPPPLIELLSLFDGQRTVEEAHQLVFQATGELRAGEMIDHLLDALDQAGFLRNGRFDELREARMRAFAEAETRPAAHAGASYPEEAEELSGWLERQAIAAAGDGNPLGIAAPHASPEGGWGCYREAYRALPASYADRTFVILGTSHYGEPEAFGLTRKPFVTPFGNAVTATDLVDEIAARAPRATRMEDYCHSIEHSIEFQVVFLQSLFGAGVKVLPILCGPFARSLGQGGLPEDDDGVHEFFDALGELHAREGKRLCWLLGIDMAHMGRRYGDEFVATAHTDAMLEVGARDKERIARLTAGDARGFWDLVQPNQDDLKWCGSSPLYTFLRAVPEARAEMRAYEQWNIDEESVVSFAGLEFRAPA
jgi:AmmeMemoRadiSam system protein B